MKFFAALSLAALTSLSACYMHAPYGASAWSNEDDAQTPAARVAATKASPQLA